VSDTATVGDLRIAIQAKLDVPVEKQTLSVNQALLMSKNPAAFTDMTDAKATLKKLNIAHGAMVTDAHSLSPGGRRRTTVALPLSRAERRAAGDGIRLPKLT